MKPTLLSSMLSLFTLLIDPQSLLGYTGSFWLSSNAILGYPWLSKAILGHQTFAMHSSYQLSTVSISSH